MIIRHPANELRGALSASVKELGEQREERRGTKRESEGASAFFGEMVKETQEAKGRVADVDLEGGGPGVAGALG